MPPAPGRTCPSGRRPRPSRSQERQLERVVAAVREAFGGDALGAYLFGSATLGGLRPRSDLDVFVVARRPLGPDDRRLLVERLLALSGGPARPVELTVVVQSDVRPWRYPPRREFQYGEWLRTELERGDLEPVAATADRDLAMLVPMVLRADRPLLGPAPSELLEPVPHEDYVRAIRDDLDLIRGGLESGADTRNVLLTLARVWSTLATREIRPKDAAADWALERLPDEHREVLAHARAVYLGAEEERWDELASRLGPHGEYVVGRIERLVGGTDDR